MLELLDALQLALRESGVFQQSLALEHVQPQMLQVPHLNLACAVPHPRNRRPREVQGIPVEVQDGLHHVGVHDVRGSLDGRGYSANRGGRLFQQRRNCRVYRNGVEHRLVTLHIDKHVALFVSRHFRNALRPGAVIRARHSCFSAKSLDGLHNALIVCRYHDAICSRGQFGPLIDALDHGFSRKTH